jgi:sulfur-oxidizing protein SoxY
MHIELHRRTFLRRFAWLSALAMVAALPGKVAFANRLQRYFATETFQQTLQQLFQDRIRSDSNLLQLDLPEIAENGAVVPLRINGSLSGIQKLYILVEKNPAPLAAEVQFSDSVSLPLSFRIKMAESCPVRVIAEINGELLQTQKWVRVIQGGCGTG